MKKLKRLGIAIAIVVVGATTAICLLIGLATLLSEIGLTQRDAGKILAVMAISASIGYFYTLLGGDNE